jgi:DNA-binding response OmpR family regulator
LLIGDDHLLGRALERALAAEGYRIARGGPAQWPCRPALVVLGPCSSGPNGAARRPDLLAGLEGLPLLVLEASPGLQARLTGWTGPLGYLAQPFDGGQFLAAVQAQLGRSGRVEREWAPEPGGRRAS